MKIKKCFLQAVSVVLCVVLAFSLSVMALAEGTAVSFVLSSAAYSEGRDSYIAQDTFKSEDVIYLKLASTQIENLGGLSYTISFDTNHFSFMEKKSVCMIEDSEPQYYLNSKDGKLRVIYENGYYGTEISVTGAVFYLAFQVKAFAESCTASFNLEINDLYDNTLSQKDIQSNLSDSITVNLSADTISAETLALFQKLETIKYPDSKEDIDAATDAYNKLTESQKKLLSQKHTSEYGWFSTALTRYNRLAEQAGKEQLFAEVEKFKKDHAGVLALTEEKVKLSDEQAVTLAKQSYDNTSAAAKTYLQNEGKLVNALSERVELLKEIKTEVDEFLGNEAYAHIWNKKILENDYNVNYDNYVSFIQLALLNHSLLSDEAKAMVTSEYEWLKKLEEEANKYLALDEAAAALAEKVAEFQKTYLYVFTLNENNVSESDRGAIQMVIDAYNTITDEELKNALASRIENLNSMLTMLDELDSEEEDISGGSSGGETQTVTKTETVTKTNKITDTIIKTLRGANSLSNTILIMFILLAVAITIMIVTYILCQQYKKKCAAESYDYDYEEA